MTFAHLSDTHLGYRAYGRTTPDGFNQREYDVMQTFKACLGAIEARDPDVVVHSGDLFHMVRPSNATIVSTFRLLDRFQRNRKGKPFILIGGNHDTPRLADSGNILRLFAEIPGLYIETRNAAVLPPDDEVLRKMELEVLCVPSNSILSKENVEWSPQLGRKYSLLVVHGMASQALPDAANFELEQTRHEKWTYVALGDYHIHQAYGKNVCYAGSTDFTSTNPWEEASSPKGWVWFDSESNTMELVPLQPRMVYDLPKIDAKDLNPEELAEKIRSQANWPEGSLPLVRQVIVHAHPTLRSRLDPKLLNELNTRALHYRLHFKFEAELSQLGEPKEAETLEHSWDEHIDSIVLPGGIVRDELKALGLMLLNEIQEREIAPVLEEALF